MRHNDLHAGNVLVHKIKPGGYFLYKINNKNYYVPNLGYVFLLWDFGMISIPGMIKGKFENKKNETDIARICSLMEHNLKKHKSTILKDVIILEGQISLHDILHNYFYTEYSKVQNNIKDSYNFDIPISQIKKAFPTYLLNKF